MFKLIGISIMAMILFDTSIMLLDAFTTNGRIQAQAMLIQQELVKNNYLSDTALETFYGETLINPDGKKSGYGLNYIADASKVYTKIQLNDSELKEIKEYGDYHVLKITAEINPWHYYFTGVVNNGEGIGRSSFLGKVEYVYYVPCLRYIK